MKDEDRNILIGYSRRARQMVARLLAAVADVDQAPILRLSDSRSVWSKTLVICVRPAGRLRRS